MKVIHEDQTFAGNVKFNNIPIYASSNLPGIATPIISNLTLVIGSGVTVSITNLLGGVDSQQLRILGDGTTTIVNNANIVTNTGANKLLAVNKVYTFSYINALKKWFENA